MNLTHLSICLNSSDIYGKSSLFSVNYKFKIGKINTLKFNTTPSETNKFLFQNHVL